MLVHEFERLQFYMTNTSLSGDYNDVGNEVPETTFASRDSKQLAVVAARRESNNLETLGSSRDKWWNWMKCDKPLDGKANSNMKVLSPDTVDHISSRFWEATGGETESRYPIVKLFLKSVQDMKVNNLDEDVDAARMNDNSGEYYNDDEMPKTLLAGKDSKQLSVMLTRRGSNNLETLEVSEDRWWNWKKCDKPLKHKMIRNMKVPSPSVIEYVCFSMVEGNKQPQCPVPYMRVVRVHVDDALNQSIKSENIITSQFDVTAETTVNERASSLGSTR